LTLSRSVSASRRTWRGDCRRAAHRTQGGSREIAASIGLDPDAIAHTRPAQNLEPEPVAERVGAVVAPLLGMLAAEPITDLKQHARSRPWAVRRRSDPCCQYFPDRTRGHAQGRPIIVLSAAPVHDPSIEHDSACRHGPEVVGPNGVTNRSSPTPAGSTPRQTRHDHRPAWASASANAASARLAAGCWSFWS
jgi:hypothetical protein